MKEITKEKKTFGIFKATQYLKIVLRQTLVNLRQLRKSIYDDKFCIIVLAFRYKCFLWVNCNKTTGAILLLLMITKQIMDERRNGCHFKANFKQSSS